MWYETTKGDYVTGIVRVRKVEGGKGVRPKRAKVSIAEYRKIYEEVWNVGTYPEAQFQNHYKRKMSSRLSVSQHTPIRDIEAAIVTKALENYQAALENFNAIDSITTWKVTLLDGSTAILIENPMEEI